MNIKEKFLELTNRTYPHGTESDLFHLLPENLQTDEFGNKYLLLGHNPSTMFTCHLDTASSRVENIKHEISGDIIRTDGKTILGADDKAGCVILLHMIKNNVPGLYYFFLGEERGCVGSRQLAQKHSVEPIEHITKVISFDRRGTDSVITHQLGGRCCSEEFGRSLSDELNSNCREFKYENDPTGIYTDSAQFTEIYPECTNISVGYNYEHSHSEFQDIRHLELLGETVVKIDWENLPVVRSTKKFQEDLFEDDYDDDYEWVYFGRNNSSYQKKTLYFIDPIYNYKSNITISGDKKRILDLDFSQDRLDEEFKLIEDLFHNFAVGYDKLQWNGIKLIIDYNPTQMSTMYREELSEYIDTMNFWKSETDFQEMT